MSEWNILETRLVKIHRLSIRSKKLHLNACKYKKDVFYMDGNCIITVMKKIWLFSVLFGYLVCPIITPAD